MKYTLITGASSGIGYELAKVFAGHGHDLILVARTEKKLKELAQDLEKQHRIKAVVVACDLSLPNSAQGLYEQIRAQNLEIDNLVNNAGFGSHGVFAESSLMNIQSMIQVNITTLTELCRLYISDMLKEKSGRILNVASTAAFQPGPMMTVYYATKAYVLHFSEGLYEELKATGISVTALCPGPTQSNFGAAANASDLPIFNTISIPTSEDVAKYGYDSLMKQKPIAIHGFVNNIMARTVGFMPRNAVRSMVMKMQSRK